MMSEQDTMITSPSVPDTSTPENLSLADLIVILWSGRWLVVLVGLLFGVAGVAYSLLATEWYRAEVVAMRADDSSLTSMAGQFGSLASLAGFDIAARDAVEPIAVLKSRQFAREFIERHDLMPIIFSHKWDSEKGNWRNDDPGKQPDLRDAVRLFNEDLRAIEEDNLTGLVTIRLDWTDPDLAAEWANAQVVMLNQIMRDRALEEAERNVSYLRDELESTSVVLLQQAIGNLLETELQKFMIARGNKEYSFRVIDTATPPKHRHRPKRILLVIMAAFLGGLTGAVILTVRQLHRGRGGTVTAPASEHAAR